MLRDAATTPSSPSQNPARLTPSRSAPSSAQTGVVPGTRYQIPLCEVPRHIVNKILNIHAPEWSGEVRSIVYSSDGKSVSVIYRVTLHGTDAEIYREATGTSSADDTGYGDPVQKAEAMAFRRACARLGLGLHLYHEDMS
ncbi:hypothetical protein OsI_04644 [Oryza sativa Indica Group]|uniref:Uncharacterized protein n=1 Tax=Oryza sativa subsp. indica TaxID=39946 RepID=B8A718_ORYSI|nr:hypothetical protein OsI_04644 [Oryza sativa Indica Group]